MATQNKPIRSRRTGPTAPRPRQSRLRPEEEVLEDDPTDPDNADPAGWPEWTDRHVYTITGR